MTDTTETVPVDELKTLKARADKLGIQYHPNIGIESLKKKINDILKPAEEIDADALADKIKSSTEETEGQKRARLHKESRRLRRIRLACMNPSKNAWPGEIFTVANAVVGTIKRYVPFNADEGWHVEEMIYQLLKDKQYQHFYTKNVNGQKVTRSRLVPEFAIEDLPPLTADQIHDLAQRQSMSGSIDNDDE